MSKNQALGELLSLTVVHNCRARFHLISLSSSGLKYYLEHTKNRRHGKKRLFISYTNQLDDVIKNTLSRWIAATIKLAYKMADDHVLRMFSLKSYDIRAINTSLNFQDSLDIIKVMNVGVWKGR